MKPHIELAHAYWKEQVKLCDCVIDATCGNGHDTLVLAQLKPQKIYALDIQTQAIANTKALLKQYENVVFLNQCHSELPSEHISLIVYNLGYLPGGDKSKTTLIETTLASLKKALHLLVPNGLISMTLYPGHAAGYVETEALIEYSATLDKNKWTVCLHDWPNRPLSPKLLLIRKLC